MSVAVVIEIVYVLVLVPVGQTLPVKMVGVSPQIDRVDEFAVADVVAAFENLWTAAL